MAKRAASDEIINLVRRGEASDAEDIRKLIDSFTEAIFGRVNPAYLM